MAFAAGDRVEFLPSADANLCGRPGDTGVVFYYDDDRNITVKNERTGHIGNKYARNLRLIAKEGNSRMTFGTIVEKAKFLALSSEDKALVKQGFQTPAGEPTQAGLALLQKLTWEANKAGLVELAQDLEAYDKAEKKA